MMNAPKETLLFSRRTQIYIAFFVLFIIARLFFLPAPTLDFPSYETPAFLKAMDTQPAQKDPLLNMNSPLEVQMALEGLDFAVSEQIYKHFFSGQRVSWVGRLISTRVYKSGVHAILLAPGFPPAVFGVWLCHEDLPRVTLKAQGYLFRFSGRLSPDYQSALHLDQAYIESEDQESLTAVWAEAIQKKHSREEETSLAPRNADHVSADRQGPRLPDYIVQPESSLVLKRTTARAIRLQVEHVLGLLQKESDDKPAQEPVADVLRDLLTLTSDSFPEDTYLKQTTSSAEEILANPNATQSALVRLKEHLQAYEFDQPAASLPSAH